MKEYIEKTLHQEIQLAPFKEINKLPLIIMKNFDFYQMDIMNQLCVLAIPNKNIHLMELRKYYRKIEMSTHQNCVLYINYLNWYSRDKMIEEGISFVWENKEIYLPFLAIALHENQAREIKPFTQISFLTQKMLLMGIYENWDNMNVTSISKKLNVSKMSITRCFDEIESFQIPLLKRKGRSRFYFKAGTKKEIWEMIEPFLRNPLIRKYQLSVDPMNDLSKSGFSALSEYSMINDKNYPTYAITKREIKALEIENQEMIHFGQTPKCEIQVLGYCISYRNKKVIDPLTTFLLLKNEMDDPRIEKAIEEMLEEYVWLEE